ncbi:hypothetical protein ED733_000873 [Metarhizium rileyi]|uniref:Fe(2+) transport protein 3 n=1 Tax=Metarhizium rileyi (strain RCEF 4871) TaxID=1649241 RepID=A0A5C6G3N0_METRR|nr:hypothetical protein ED733_000873 [Metarhizium rileyi]
MDEVKPQCGAKGGGEPVEYDVPLHVAGLFVVLLTSCIGCGFPVAAKKIKWLKIPPKVFFACKHFGTGVLIATAFVHLLPTAFSSLGDPCLPDLFTKDYPPLPGVIMMGSLFLLFVIELWLNSKTGGHSHGGPTGADLSGGQPGAVKPYAHGQGHGQGRRDSHEPTSIYIQDVVQHTHVMPDQESAPLDYRRSSFSRKSLDDQTLHDDDEKARRLSTMPPWFAAFYEQYIRQHTELLEVVRKPRDESSRLMDEEKANARVAEYAVEDEDEAVDQNLLKKMSANITLLEGGILFHSVFVGMTISITTEGFIILLVAISFHQLFEGLGLGSRIAAVPYPKKSIRPWVLVLAFGTTAPIGQAIGLITRNSYDPQSAFGLIIVGVFNAISSGLLIYAALVDLLAEDFLSEEANELMNGKTKAKAFAWVLLGALGMSIVGAFA